MASKTGEQALRAAFGPNPPDLILLDIVKARIRTHIQLKRKTDLL
jgi:hypothetical protein